MDINICKVDGCGKGILAKGYCNKHYKQNRIHGRIFRTRYDPNEIVVKNGYAEMLLYDSKGIERAKTIIDIEDISLIKQYKWCYKEGYAMSGSNDKKTMLHRLVTKAPNEKVVDHINHNTLDNRKPNLRICSVKENSRNLKNVEGVYYREDRNKWKAKIWKDGKSIYLGLYETKVEARQARMLAEKQYFGEFAPIRRNI